MPGLLVKFILIITTLFVLIAIDYLYTRILILSLMIETFGNFGDFIGGISSFIGTVVSIFVFYYVIKTFRLQKKQLKSQKKELIETKQQLKLQQFENIYFKMLDVIHTIGKEIQAKSLNDYFVTFKNDLGNDYVSLLTPGNSFLRHHHDILRMICAEFNDIYTEVDLNSMHYLERERNTFLGRLHAWRSEDKEERTKVILGYMYESRFIKSNSPFGHYFRYIINAIDYVENEITYPKEPEREKFERLRYVKLISAQLANTQLVILFYSCLSRISYDSNKQPTAKKLMEKYEFFKNLLPQNLISPWHQDFYKIPYKFPYNGETEGSDKRI